MARKIKVADLLCGAGGSSEGAKRALDEMGLEMDLVCVNHWPTAINTHERNFPEARHYIQDISTVRPHILVPEGYLDLLMASPTCTHHSNARGGKPTSDQQRSDPWHIVTWLTELRVKRIIIENVWEYIGWGPVNMKTGKPIASRKGEYFHAWTETLRRLGFELEWRRLNAADFGDATTRQRFILLGRSDGRKIHWPMPTHKRRDELKADLFTAEKPWRPAREIIDWSIKGKSIFGRKKPLSWKSLDRLLAGMLRHNWPSIFVEMIIPEIERSLAYSIRENMRRRHVGKRGDGQKARGLVKAAIRRMRKLRAEPPSVQKTTKLPSPMIVTMRRNADGRSPELPLPAILASGQHIALAEPFILSQASGGAARPVSDPIPAAPCGGAHALIAPYYGSGSGESCISTEVPLPTLTAKARFGMVVPVTNGSGGAKARDVNREPLPTMTTAKGGEFALAEGTAGHDILYRMLKWPELAAAMGFSSEESTYEFAGTATEIIKQIGNAVSVAKMKACVGAIMADAAPKLKQAPTPEFLEAAE
ncbi:DNA cytosine methyltransferase [Rhizobium rhizogenes]|uniref:DNA cytosine methyltransferase n=1 Tax=Rhizobium rhizogenes TaxID=359 RepID=UPI0024BE1C27|nr:DNA cytosine methyltransferase [Rhizobium rhizogenes]MDJ1632272.1 DNA cytosine methyltransferase [Rhizobium rhizogenes]